MSAEAPRRAPELAELLTRIHGLRLDAQRLVEGLLSGHHRSPHHGVSVEFAEHKEYAPGDELRSIDWKAYARNDRLQVKRFHHETDLTARLIVDVSGSMAYGDGATMKYRAAAVFALAVAYVLLRQGDRVELLVAGAALRGRVPPRPGLGHFQALGDLLERTTPRGATAIGSVLEGEIERIGRRRAVILVTDGFEEPESLFRPLRALKARQCSVMLVQILHGDELDFPFEGVRDFRSLERDARLVTEPQLIRRMYLGRMKEHLSALARIARRSHIGYQVVRSDQPLDAPLFELLRVGLP